MAGAIPPGDYIDEFCCDGCLVVYHAKAMLIIPSNEMNRECQRKGGGERRKETEVHSALHFLSHVSALTTVTYKPCKLSPSARIAVLGELMHLVKIS